MQTQTYLKSFLLPAIAVLFFSLPACDTTVNTDIAEVGEAIERKDSVEANTFFKVDTAQSEATWIGAKITGQHNGLFHIQEGQLELQDSLLVGGSIIFDMLATRSQDKNLDAKSNNKLTTHLKSTDFFDVTRYPTASFEITSVMPFDSATQKINNARKYSELRIMNPTHRLTGNLTIKAETKSVTFPARITMTDGELKAQANFNIDRTQWGLIYRSDQALGNQTVYPEVNIDLDILAKPISPEQAIK